jgi:glycosyltransferase involved in cell wall biosynthesis
MLAFMSRRTRVFAVSQATAGRFCGRLPFGDRARVIHNGTDLRRFPLKRPGEAPFKAELGLSQESFLICAVGQICARKGLRELIDAFSGVHADAPHIHLAIVGRAVFEHEERYRTELLEQVKRAGLTERVHFAGERRDVAAILQSADLLVLNSRQEPFGLVLVEAMSCGTPVLAARVGGIPEIVTDSVTGWLVEADAAALGAKLVELSRQPEELARVARVARDTVCAQFSLEEFRRKLDEAYADLSPRPKPQRNTSVYVAPAHQ